nr:recombinase family protein [Bacillus subtilis]
MRASCEGLVTPSLYNPLAIASKPFPAIYSEKILIFTIFSAFAEFERDMIVERTQEGKMLAKQNPDFREGRPKKFTKQQINHALTLLENHSYKQVEDMTGISVSTLVRAKKKKAAEAING